MDVPVCIKCNRVSKENCWACRKLLKYEVALFLRKLFGANKIDENYSDIQVRHERCKKLVDASKNELQRNAYSHLEHLIVAQRPVLIIKRDVLVDCFLHIAEVSRDIEFSDDGKKDFNRVYLDERNRNKGGRPKVINKFIENRVVELKSQGMGARRITRKLAEEKIAISVSSIQRLMKSKK